MPLDAMPVFVQLHIGTLCTDVVSSRDMYKLLRPEQLAIDVCWRCAAAPPSSGTDSTYEAMPIEFLLFACEA